MKTAKKTAMIIAVFLTVVGLLISFGAMIALDFDFLKMNTASFVTNTYSVNEKFTNISVEGAECNVRLLPSSDDSCIVVCDETEKISHSVVVKNNTLTIERHDHRKWYEHIGIYFGKMEIAVYLPQSEYEDLYIKNLSGDIDIPETYTFDSADIQSTSGNISFLSSVTNDLSVKTVSGNLYVGKTNPQKLSIQSTSGDITAETMEIEEALQIKAVSGNIELSDIKCQSIAADTTSGEVVLSDVIANENIRIESVSGDVKLRQCDAETLWLKTSSGNVTGSLLTEKTFLTNTSSGDIDVPRSASGGKCEVETTSGNIKFEIS